MRQLVGDTSDRFAALCCGATGPIGLAVSGGSDSMALLHLALNWAPAERFVVLTVDHGLRPEAREEARTVAGHCARLGLAHETLTWTPPSGHVSQARARDGRHRLLANALRACGGSHLLLGHTLDDQHETVTMRARRGTSGLAGMRGLSISPVWPDGRDIFLARPLLGCRRAALRDFLLRHAVDWIDDPSNENTGFERVRVRKALSVSNADGSADEQGFEGRHQAAKAERRQRDKVLAVWLDEHVQAHPDGLIVCEPAALTGSEFAEALSYLLLAASGSDTPASLSGRVNLAHDILADQRHWRSRTLGGAWLAPRRGRVQIARDPGHVPPGPDITPLSPSGSVVWDGRFELVIGDNRRNETLRKVEDIEIAALSRAGFPVFENEHALLRCLVPDRLDAVKNVLGHESCVFAC